jgi:hypothetical protein
MVMASLPEPSYMSLKNMPKGRFAQQHFVAREMTVTKSEKYVNMADIKSGPAQGDEETVALIELLFFAYRDFVSDPDELLKELGFGRAHHRVVHFAGRWQDGPRCSISCASPSRVSAGFSRI